jgi:hypothetical protein
MIDFEIDDELLTRFHQPASLSDSISFEDSRLSMSQKMIVSYDLLDMNGKYGFNQAFTQEETSGYFTQMWKYANVSMNEIIDTFDYTEHFNGSAIRGNLLYLLKKKTGKHIDDGVMIYHFALQPENKQVASREQNTRNARIYFLVGKFGIVHVLFFDPYHEINP